MKLVLFNQTNVGWWKSNSEIPAWETFSQLVSLRLIRPLELNREKGSVKTRKGESLSWRERERERGWITCQPLSLCTEQLSYVSPLDTSTPLTEPIREAHVTRWVYKIQKSVSLEVVILDLSNVSPLIYVSPSGHYKKSNCRFHKEQIKYYAFIIVVKITFWYLHSAFYYNPLLKKTLYEHLPLLQSLIA